MNLTQIALVGVGSSLSTFSTFVYGAIILMTASFYGLMIALIYLIVSMVVGYIALGVGHRISKA